MKTLFFSILFFISSMFVSAQSLASNQTTKNDMLTPEMATEELKNIPIDTIIGDGTSSSSDDYFTEPSTRDVHYQNLLRLLRASADPNVLNSTGRSPLHLAAGGGNIRLIQLLIAYNANPNLPDQYGDSPLYYASFAGRSLATRYLIFSGADPNLLNSAGQSPLRVAGNTGTANVLTILGGVAIGPLHEMRPYQYALYPTALHYSFERRVMCFLQDISDPFLSLAGLRLRPENNQICPGDTESVAGYVLRDHFNRHGELSIYPVIWPLGNGPLLPEIVLHIAYLYLALAKTSRSL